MPSRALKRHYDSPAEVGGPLKLLRKAAEHGYRTPLGAVIDWLVVAFLAVLPVIRSYDLLKPLWWAWAWVVIFAGKEVYGRARLGKYAEVGGARVARIHSSVAGSIDDLMSLMINSAGRQLNEDTSRALVVGLLGRIKEYAITGLHSGDDCRLRVTLAVPLPTPSAKDGRAKSIKVWCYDETHDDRAYTELPINYAMPLAGSPLAFVSGSIQIIADIRAEPDAIKDRNRKYRSIVSIPVKAGGPRARVIAVLNIDATEPNLFTEESVERAIIPLVAPSVNLVGLVLLLRREDSRYAFNS